MLELKMTSKFSKDLKTCVKRGKDISKLHTIIDLLQTEQELPSKNKDHPLIGNWVGYRECHIEPDWLLIYSIQKKEGLLVLDELTTKDEEKEAVQYSGTLTLNRSGSHADLF